MQDNYHTIYQELPYKIRGFVVHNSNEDFYTIDGLNFEGYSYTREDENGTLFIDEGSKDVDEKELLNVIKFDRFTQRMGIKPKELENENTTYNKKKQLKYWLNIKNMLLL